MTLPLHNNNSGLAASALASTSPSTAKLSLGTISSLNKIFSKLIRTNPLFSHLANSDLLLARRLILNATRTFRRPLPEPIPPAFGNHALGVMIMERLYLKDVRRWEKEVVRHVAEILGGANGVGFGGRKVATVSGKTPPRKFNPLANASALGLTFGP